tara:strand:- start:244 stop:1386 length:1143 start_codon:yes stop_codon:yes gene_type:complete
MLYYTKHFVDSNDIKYVKKILKEKKLTQGKYVNLFENKLKTRFGSKYCTVLSNGTAALFLAIKSLNLKKRSKVITTPITFSATVSSALMNGLDVNYVDIDDTTYTIDTVKLEKKLKKNNIKLLIAVDYAGHPCDWEKINYLKKKYNFKVLNDNCHAIGSKYNNDIKYALKYSDLVTQSFHPAKAITTGEGGAVYSNIKKIDDKIKKMRNHGFIKTKEILNKGIWNSNIDNLGYNFRLPDLNCALGISQLSKLDKFIQKRRELAKTYDNQFKNINGIKLPKVNKNVYHSYHIYPMLIDFDKLNIKKKDFFKKLIKKKINLQVHYKPVFLFDYFRKKTNFDLKEFNNSLKFYKQEVSLPLFYSLSIKEQKRVIKEIKNLLNN